VSDLETFLTTGVFAFLLCFVRVGTAVMLMPGIGTAYVPQNVRLFFSLAFSFVLFPLLQSRMPNPLPDTFPLFSLILMEFIIGFFIGTISRVLMAAIDTAGMIVSTQSSLANAQLFNPALASQGSVIGVFLTLTAMMLLFATDLHHLLVLGIVQSYDIFPIGKEVDFGSMANFLTDTVAGAFAVGIQMTAPFLVLVLLLYVGMGIMSKLMPQIQVFMLAVPVQILLALVTLTLVISAMMLVWLAEYEKGMRFFLGAG
jgi:flagellar biosynthetic protein FliR